MTDSQLDTEIIEIDMIVLAAHFDNIETYSTLFELTDSKKQDVIDEKIRYDTQTAMSLAMKLWRRRNPAVATYRALVEIVLSLRKVDVATKVCEFLASKCECQISFMCMHVDYEILFPDPTVRAQKPPQATESPNDEPTCPAVQSTQVTEQEDTGELSLIHNWSYVYIPHTWLA